MATSNSVNQGKTAFVEEFLGSHRDAYHGTVNEAWVAAGNKGSVSPSLVGKLRRKLGLTGKRGTNGGATKETAVPSAKGKATTSPKPTKVKGASKSGEAPSQLKGREGDTGPGKSAFVEEMLKREPKANVKALNGAWQAAGNDGTISESLISKTRRELGLTGKAKVGASNRSSDARGAAPKAAKATVRTGVDRPVEARLSGKDRTPLLIRLEGEIDDMLHEIRMAGGLPEFEETLRKARRILVRSHEE